MLLNVLLYAFKKIAALEHNKAIANVVTVVVQCFSHLADTFIQSNSQFTLVHTMNNTDPTVHRQLLYQQSHSSPYEPHYLS